jgi:uncharacterized protein (DUF2267 family)
VAEVELPASRHPTDAKPATSSPTGQVKRRRHPSASNHSRVSSILDVEDRGDAADLDAASLAVCRTRVTARRTARLGGRLGTVREPDEAAQRPPPALLVCAVPLEERVRRARVLEELKTAWKQEWSHASTVPANLYAVNDDFLDDVLRSGNAEPPGGRGGA